MKTAVIYISRQAREGLKSPRKDFGNGVYLRVEIVNESQDDALDHAKPMPDEDVVNTWLLDDDAKVKAEK